MLDEAEVGGEVVDTGAPGVGGRAVPAPALPLFAIKRLEAGSGNPSSAQTFKLGVDVDHVDLGVRVSRLDADVDVGERTVVAGWYREIIQDDSQDAALRDQFEPVGCVAEPH